MCGIAGFCINKNDHLPELSSIVDELLLEIEARGQDSTGMAWVDNRRRMFIHKDNVRASKYVRGGAARRVNGARMGVLHTRYATQGKPEFMFNNHPILHGNVVGVHNGHIGNDDDIFRDLDVRRHGEVDSEAAFALLDNEPDTLAALQRLRGNAALAWFDRRDRALTLHLARVYSSPVAVAMTRRGSFFFASTMPMLERALDRAGVPVDWKMELSEGTYIKVRNGRIESFDSFTPPRPYLSMGTSRFSVRRAARDRADDTWFGTDGMWLDDDTFVPYLTD